MPSTPPLKVLSQLGLSKSLQRIKFGGVVGKQSLLAVIGAGALATIAWRTDGNGPLVMGVLTFILLAGIAILNFRYADRHPMEATLEGAEILAFQHQVLAAKSLEPPNNQLLIPNPGGAEPQANPPEEIEQ